MKKVMILFPLVFLFAPAFLWAEERAPDRVPAIRGVVYDETHSPMVAATVFIEGTTQGTTTDNEGRFALRHLSGKCKIVVSFVGYATQNREIDLDVHKSAFLTFNLLPDQTQLSEVEVFGERYKQPTKLDAITRMPLRPSEQIQSISIISDKSIAEQGALTITEATRNIPGVSLFGSYGGVRESMSIRGYRGVPVLKNGVRIDSDFRTGSALSEMQGVESIQVIKGSAAVTQGIGNDLGSAGGVINVVTKTPKFIDAGEVSVRAGSWGEFRPSFDLQTILDKSNTVALRVNGVYQRKDNYRPVIHGNRVYINPSFEWRPNEKTAITLEMDYLNDNQTPYTSTVNLSDDSKEDLYTMPHNKFLGFRNDNVNNKTLTYAVRMTRSLNDNFSFRAAYFGSSYKVDNTSTAVNTVVKKEYNMRRRTLSRSLRDDKNSTFQLDFIGRDVFTGPIRHTFQVGFDYKNTDLSTTSLGSAIIDTINVLAPVISNVLPRAVTFKAETPVTSSASNYGIMVQEMMNVNKYLKLVLGLRYSFMSSTDASSAGPTTGDAWNPMMGVMLTPIKNINLFGSYTTTTSLRGSANKMPDGTEIGPSTTRQFETGLKSDWLDNRLRFNFTFFNIMQKNLSYTIYDEETLQDTGYKGKAGNLKRNGIETELSGRIFENLQVILGYSYLDAQYEDSPAYQDGSAPMNTPGNTANGWVQFTFNKSVLKGLSVGVGAYYIGKRPMNDWTLKMDGHGSIVGAKPFDMPAYITVNAQLAYQIGKFTTRVYLNNLFDAIGYNSYYRGGYINQIDPRNFSAIVSYNF